MNSRDIATICGVVMRLAGIPLLIWGPSKETFYVGLMLIAGGDVGLVARALIPGLPTQLPKP